MSKFSFKKLLLTGMTYAATAAIAIGSTFALLQDGDITINVMAVGNVSVENLIYERNGEALREFTQSAPLYPAVFTDANTAPDVMRSWSDTASDSNASNLLYPSTMKNVRDMFTFVHNAGETPAYVRTWFAFEQGTLTEAEFQALIVTNVDDQHWSWGETEYDVTIDGNLYAVVCATYIGSGTDASVLAPKTVSYPSLLQLYMSPEATNEDCLAADSNQNGEYDVLVYTQTVQTQGFEPSATPAEPQRTPLEAAQNALDTAYAGNPWTNFTWPTVLAAYRSNEQEG